MCCVVAVVVKYLMAMVKISTLGHTCMCCVVLCSCSKVFNGYGKNKYTWAYMYVLCCVV